MAAPALEGSIERIRGRIRLLLAVRWAVLFALGGTAASLLGLIAVRIAGIAFPLPEVFGGLLLITLLGAVFGYLRRVTPFQAAVTTDARLDLKDRLSSALALQAHADSEPLVAALVEDATRHAGGIDVRAAYPVRAPRETRLLAGALAALLLAVFLPQLPWFQSPAKRAEREAMKVEGARIVRVAREMRKHAEAKKVDLARQVARNLEQLGKEMRAGRLTKKQSLVKLHKMTKELAEAQKKLAGMPAGKSLAKAAEELKKSAKDAQAGAQSPEGAKRLKEMAEALSRNDMDKAAALLKQMADQIASGKMSKEQLQQMAREAQKMAQAMSGTQLQKAAQQLQKAAQQMQQGQMAAAAQQMRQAGGT